MIRLRDVRQTAGAAGGDGAAAADGGWSVNRTGQGVFDVIRVSAERLDLGGRRRVVRGARRSVGLESSTRTVPLPDPQLTGRCLRGDQLGPMVPVDVGCGDAQQRPRAANQVGRARRGQPDVQDGRFRRSIAARSACPSPSRSARRERSAAAAEGAHSSTHAHAIQRAGRTRVTTRMSESRVYDARGRSVVGPRWVTQQAGLRDCPCERLCATPSCLPGLIRSHAEGPGCL